MSAIGSGNLGAINLAGSLAGAQQTNSGSDRVKEEASQRNFQVDRKAMSANSIEDVGQTDQATDRDADGRMAYSYDESDPEKQANSGGTNSAEDLAAKTKRKSEDAFGEKGTALDIEA